MASRKSAVWVGVLAVLLACPGCGIVFNGTTQRVLIQSEPSGAMVTISTVGGAVGTTPTVVRLDRDEDHLITVSKEGYETRNAYVSSELEPISVILDIFLWGGLGLLVDWPLGAMFELRPNTVFVPLPKKP